VEAELYASTLTHGIGTHDDPNMSVTPGISGMSVYVPRLRVPLEQWCAWTDNPWEKVKAVVGHSFRVPAPHENVYTMAANAVLRLIEAHDVDPENVGMLALGTESSTDNAAGAVIVRGMVDRALLHLGKPRLSRELEVPELKHACLGGIYALKGALRYVAADGKGRQAIVVSADIAEYERGSTGEQTQGAGAVAMLVEADPKLVTVDLERAGSASDYRGPDFRKPFARHFSDAYAPNTDRRADFPVFSGKYSTFAYVDETVHAVEAMLKKQDTTAGKYYRGVRALFFHRPYKAMPIQAMSFLYVRGLAQGEHHRDELAALCEKADVSVDEVVAEAAKTPDLFGELLAGGAPQDPYEATSRVASKLRKEPDFRALLDEKMSLGSELMMELGNLYSAALPAWLAAGLEEAAERDLDLADSDMVAVGYGSGDAAEAMPFHVVPGYAEAAKRLRVRESLERDAVDLNREQYEALHDGRPVPELDLSPRREFAIERVGERYDRDFQDLGVEYYEYVA
jgi:hydroxymethylglutaryl-CoA synthase